MRPVLLAALALQAALPLVSTVDGGWTVTPARAFGTVRDLPATGSDLLVLRIDPGVPAEDPDFPPGAVLVTRNPDSLAPSGVIRLAPQRSRAFAMARLLAGRPSAGDEAVLPRGDLEAFVEGALEPRRNGRD